MHAIKDCKILLEKKIKQARDLLNSQGMGQQDRSALFAHQAGFSIATFASILASKDTMIIHSGASDYMSPDASAFGSYNPVNDISKVVYGISGNLSIKGSGNVVIKAPSNISFTMHRVLHVPGLPVALFSVGRTMEDGLRVVFDKGVCTITDPRSGFCLVSKFLKDLGHNTKLFRIHTAHVATTAAQLGDDTSLWHQRLRYIGITSLKNIGDHLDDSPLSLQNVAKSSPLLLQNIANSSPATICTPCMQAKQMKLPCPSATSIPSTQVLQFVHGILLAQMQWLPSRVTIISLPSLTITLNGLLSIP